MKCIRCGKDSTQVYCPICEKTYGKPASICTTDAALLQNIQTTIKKEQTTFIVGELRSFGEWWKRYEGDLQNDLPEGKAGDEMVMAARRRVAKLCVMGVETCRREADDAEILRLHDILTAALDRAMAAYTPGDNAKEKAFTHIKSSKISCEKIMRARR